MKGYKVFNPDWTCKGFKYEVGKDYVFNGKPRICKHGFHFCLDATDCFKYYSFNPQNKVAEVEALGETVTHRKDSKMATNHIKIIREIAWEELLKIVNSGNHNSGYGNSGNRNSGDRNSGDRNSGDYNTGYGNSGDYNSGYGNSGDYNTSYGNSGDYNSGYRNSGYGNPGDYNSGYGNSGDYNSGYGNPGDYNTGYGNTGYRNSGDYNSGDYNSGDGNSGYGNSGYGNSGYRNSGDYNSGNRNSGYRNSGYGNTGDGNSGDYNSGYGNSGNHNSGDYNSCNYSSGIFNTKLSTIRIFNKQSNITYKEWKETPAHTILGRLVIVEFIPTAKMSKYEKSKHKEYNTLGGYNKKYTYEQAFRNLWHKLTQDEKNIVMSIPNFDKEIFKKITGIKI